MEVFGLSRVCHRICHFKEVNDTNDFEVSKFGGTIEWGYGNKFSKKLNTFLSKKNFK